MAQLSRLDIGARPLEESPNGVRPLDPLRTDKWIARGIVGCLIVVTLAPVLASSFTVFEHRPPDFVINAQYLAFGALLAWFTGNFTNSRNGKTPINGGGHGPTVPTGTPPDRPPV